MPILAHIGAGLVAKRAAPQVNVAVLVTAAMALDILTVGTFALSRVVFLPGHYKVWTHGIFAALAWSLIGGLIIWRLSRDRRAAVVIGLVIFSHWVLDFMAWPPNEILSYYGGPEIGLGIFRRFWREIVFEFGILAVGLIVYLRARHTGQNAASASLPQAFSPK